MAHERLKGLLKFLKFGTSFFIVTLILSFVALVTFPTITTLIILYFSSLFLILLSSFAVINLITIIENLLKNKEVKKSGTRRRSNR